MTSNIIQYICIYGYVCAYALDNNEEYCILLFYFSTLFPLDQILDSGTTKQMLFCKPFSVTNVAAEPSSPELSLFLHLSIYCGYRLLSVD